MSIGCAHRMHEPRMIQHPTSNIQRATSNLQKPTTVVYTYSPTSESLSQPYNWSLDLLPPFPRNAYRTSSVVIVIIAFAFVKSEIGNCLLIN